MRNRIYDYERSGYGTDEDLLAIAETYIGQGYIYTFRKEDWSSYKELKAEWRKQSGGSFGGENNKYYPNGKPRGYNFEESDGSGGENGKSGTINTTTQYSLSDNRQETKKTYSRNEMEATLNDIVAFGVFGDGLAKLKQGNKGKAIDYVYELMNNTKVGDEQKAAKDFAEYMVLNSVTNDMKKEELLRLDLQKLSYFRENVMKKFDLSGIADEMKYKFGKSHGGILLSWNNKNAQPFDGWIHENIDGLRANGITVTAENQADAFFELYGKYLNARSAVESLERKTLETTFSEIELNEFKNEIEQEVLQAFKDKGTFNKKVSNIIKENVKLTKINKTLLAKVKTEMKNAKVYIKVVDLIKTAKEYVGRDYFGASILTNENFKDVTTKIGGMVKGNKLDMIRVKKVIGLLKKAYVENDFIENGLGNQFSADLTSAIEYLDNSIEIGVELNLNQMEALKKVVVGVCHLYKSADNQLKNGKLVETGTLGLKTLNMERKLPNIALLNGRRARQFQYMTTDAKSVFGYVVGYDENNPFMEAFQDVYDGESKKEVLRMQMLKKLDNYIKKTKGYKKRLKNTTIPLRLKNKSSGEFETVNIPLEVAMALYETSKREQAQTGLYERGFSFDVKKIEKHYSITKADIETIKESFTQEDYGFMEAVETMFEMGRDLKVETDEAMYGFTNIIDGFYYPIIRDKMSIAESLTSQKTSLENFASSVNNMSFNKKTKKGSANGLYILPITEMAGHHATQVSTYNALAVPINNFNKLYNKKIDGDVTLRSYLDNKFPGFNQYVKKMFKDIQGLGEVKDGASKMVSKIRQLFATYQLGANIKTMCTQFVSYITTSIYLRADDMVKGLKPHLTQEQIFEACPFLEARAFDNSAVNANIVMDKFDSVKSGIGKVNEILMTPIGKVDMFTVKRIFEACCHKMARVNKTELWSKENLADAAKYAEMIIKATQSGSTQLERTGAMRSNSELVRAFTMFMSEPTKQLSRLSDAVGKLAYAIASKDKTRIAEATKGLAITSTAVAMSATMYTLFAMAIKSALGGTSDKEKEKTFMQNVWDGLANSMTGMFPVLRDIYNYCNYGFGSGTFLGDYIDQIGQALKSVTTTFDKVVSGEEISQSSLEKPLKDLLFAIGMTTGMPTRNIWNTTNNLIKKYITPSTENATEEVKQSGTYKPFDFTYKPKKGYEDLEFNKEIYSQATKMTAVKPRMPSKDHNVVESFNKEVKKVLK